jgi:hypothetical protein
MSLTLMGLVFERPYTIGIRLLFILYLCVAATLLVKLPDGNLTSGIVGEVLVFGENLLLYIYCCDNPCYADLRLCPETTRAR